MTALLLLGIALALGVAWALAPHTATAEGPVFGTDDERPPLRLPGTITRRGLCPAGVWQLRPTADPSLRIEFEVSHSTVYRPEGTRCDDFTVGDSIELQYQPSTSTVPVVVASAIIRRSTATPTPEPRQSLAFRGLLLQRPSTPPHYGSWRFDTGVSGTVTVAVDATTTQTGAALLALGALAEVRAERTAGGPWRATSITAISVGSDRTVLFSGLIEDFDHTNWTARPWRIGGRTVHVLNRDIVAGTPALYRLVEVEAHEEQSTGQLRATAVRVDMRASARDSIRLRGLVRERPPSPVQVGTWEIGCVAVKVTAQTKITGSITTGSSIVEVVADRTDSLPVATEIRLVGVGPSPEVELTGLVTDDPSQSDPISFHISGIQVLVSASLRPPTTLARGAVVNLVGQCRTANIALIAASRLDVLMQTHIDFAGQVVSMDRTSLPMNWTIQQVSTGTSLVLRIDVPPVGGGLQVVGASVDGYGYALADGSVKVERIVVGDRRPLPAPTASPTPEPPTPSPTPEVGPTTPTPTPTPALVRRRPGIAP